jgi:hypothetical protein
VTDCTDRPSAIQVPETLTLEDLHLAGRPYRRLAHHQVTVSALVNMTAEDLLAYPGLGEGSVASVIVCLGRFGLSLRPSPPPPEPERRRLAKERGAAMRERWVAGETLDQIAASAGISRERVRQLIWRADPNAAVARRAIRKAAQP